MTARILKKLLGEAAAGLDQSHGTDTLLQVLTQLITEHNALIATVNILRANNDDAVAQFNTLKGEYDAETNASHVDSAADDLVATTSTAVTAELTIES